MRSCGLLFFALGFAWPATVRTPERNGSVTQNVASRNKWVHTNGSDPLSMASRIEWVHTNGSGHCVDFFGILNLQLQSASRGGCFVLMMTGATLGVGSFRGFHNGTLGFPCSLSPSTCLWTMRWGSKSGLIWTGTEHSISKRCLNTPPWHVLLFSVLIQQNFQQRPTLNTTPTLSRPTQESDGPSRDHHHPER